MVINPFKDIFGHPPMVHLEVSHGFLFSYRVDFNPPWLTERPGVMRALGVEQRDLGETKFQRIQKNQRFISCTAANFVRLVQDGSRWFKCTSNVWIELLHSCLSLEVAGHCELPAPTSFIARP